MSVWWQLRNYFAHRLESKGAHGIHSPFVYHLYQDVIVSSKTPDITNQIEAERSRLLLDSKMLLVDDLGAGSRKSLSNNRLNKRRIRDIARTALKPADQAAFLYRLAAYMEIRYALELGTSLGVSTAYLSQAVRKLVTVEGASAVFHEAANTFERLGLKNIEQHQLAFDDFLQKNHEPFDMVYIDGNHTYKATVRYFQHFTGGMHKPKVIVFDDIYWSKGMTKAWRQIIAETKAGITVDLFHFGLVFPNREQAVQHFKIRMK